MRLTPSRQIPPRPLPLPGPFGACTRPRPVFTRRRLRAEPFCAWRWQMSRGRWGLRAAQRPPPAIKDSGPAGGSARRAAADRRRMEGNCPHSLSAALPPQGYSPLSSRCGGRPGPALTALPSPRSPAPFWRPWVPVPDEAARRSGPGPAAVSGAWWSFCRRHRRARGWGIPAGRGCSGRARCRAGGLTSALSSAASQPRRADGSLPKAGAVHAPRQVSGSPQPPPVPRGTSGHRGAVALRGQEGPLLAGLVS